MLDFTSVWQKLNRGYTYEVINGIGFFTLPSFSATGLVQHGFTARSGGISQGPYSTLNLSFSRDDEPYETVLENYRLFADAAEIAWDSMVMDTFEHGTNITRVGKYHKGAGYLAPPLLPCDGLITNDPEITLVTGHADCLPIYFLDPVHFCIGLVHAGWKGTLNKICLRAIELMQKHYQTEPAHLFAGVGPCICKECFEVDYDLGERFNREFPDIPCVSPGKAGKAHVDLSMATVAQCLAAGLLPENISCVDVCTFEDKERLFSYRRDCGNTGGMAAFIKLIDNRQ